LNAANSIAGLIAAARRRAILQLLLEQFSWGLAAGLAAFSLLLLLGSEVLRWYWPLLLVALTAGIGWWRSRSRVPNPYRVAQSVDRSLGLADLVSTAYYFENEKADRPPEAQFLAVVQQRAGSVAATVDPRCAVPLTWPRAAWFASAALGLATVLFTVRYGVLRTFDLRSPLASVNFDTLTGAPQPAARQLARKNATMPDLPGIRVQDPEGAAVDEKETAIQESLRSVDVNDANQVGAPGAGERSKAAGEDQSGENSEEGDDAAAGKQKKLPAGVEELRQPADSSQAQKGGQPRKDNSLMDKMRDALANLMDKLKMEPPSADGKQSASKAGPKSGRQKGEKGPPQQGKSDRQGDPNEAQPGEQQSEADAAQQAKSNQPGNQDPASNQEKSGIGRQDGKKDTELAEQQQALGKLSELLGKRALSVQAEVMVEVTNSKNQSLRTPYVNRTGRHMESGSDLNRDEVPLHLQDYVQRYYEQVRKPAAPAQPAAPRK
jgi:hypothetical protein